MRQGIVLGESTVPTAETNDGCAPKRGLGLKWIFPFSDAAPLALVRPHSVLGRGVDCDIRVDCQGVSRRHAEIYREGPIFAIRDLDSTNGVHIDGERMQHAPLRVGQLVRIGDWVGALVAVDESSGAQADPFAEISPGFFGGAELRAVLRRLELVAKHDLPIILQGETGTGKERAARSIHAWSDLPGSFHAVNCAALPASMVEGELFGYRKGAFSGAARSHLGHIRAAHRGTLFLDEIADLSLDIQAKLLRVLEEGQVTPLGEHRAEPVQLRVVCATQQPLSHLVECGRFRADLHARLAGYTCLLPPLRERRADVPQLFAAFLLKYSGGSPPDVDAKLVEQLCLYDWPNNVRELELLTRRLLVLHGHAPQLRRAFLPEELVRCRREPLVEPSGNNGTTDRKSYELERLIRALKTSHGNVSRAAAQLGLSRQRVYRLMNGRSIEDLLNERLLPDAHLATLHTTPDE
jgi:transcriptional regulator of acetoin/glycerol metabolism